MRFISFCVWKNKIKLNKCEYSTRKLINSLLAMPKNGDQELLRRQRIKLKEKALKYVPGTVTLQVLGSGAAGSPAALYVFTDQSRYLFNVGEGSQRLAHEHKMKLSKLEHIFITRPTWDYIGGLPGVALTIQDVGVPTISLHGPKGTEDIFAATHRFVVLKELELRMMDCESSQQFQDSVMAVSYVHLTPTNGQETSKQPVAIDRSFEVDDVDYYGHERRRGSTGNRRPIQQGPRVSSDRIPPTAISYICQLKPKLGTLRLDACVERGVRPGPLLGQLKNGNDVTLPDGTVVRSADVTSPDEPGPVFIVVDCPSEDYLPSLVSNELWAPYQAGGTSENLMHTIVHFSSEDVIDHHLYTQWISRFPPNTLHLYLNTRNSCTGSLAIHRVQEQLHNIHPRIFPRLSTTIGLLPSATVNDTCLNGNNGTSAGQNTPPDALTLQSEQPYLASVLSCINLRPLGGLDTSLVPTLTPELYLTEPYNTDEFKLELDRFRRAASATPPVPYQEYPKIVFLGTGSCIPNKTRNTSGILLFTSETSCVLLDCGEATFHQISRLYGPDTRRVMSTLRAIYVSHLHADHHLGLIGVLKGRRRLLGGESEPVYLLAPHQIMFWLNVYHERFEDILQEFQLVSNGSLKSQPNRPGQEELLSATGCSNIQTVGVRHCPNAFGVALTLCDGWKLTYSGDTMPSDDLVRLGMDSDVLIHEATMEDELEDEAKLKLHSTTAQALAVGKAMQARHIILTHFSQRYSKIPRINGEYPSNVGLAFDNMQISVGDLWLLPLMYPILKLLFADHIDEMDVKALRRNMRKEFKRSASQSPPPSRQPKQPVLE